MPWSMSSGSVPHPVNIAIFPSGELALVYAFVFLFIACRGAGKASLDGRRGSATILKPGPIGDDPFAPDFETGDISEPL